MAAHDAAALLKALELRGLMCGATQEQALSCAEQARLMLAAYCRLPESAPLPDGLFYGWLTLTAVLIGQMGDNLAGGVTAISEGDTSISFAQSGGNLPPLCKAVADRFRRLD